MQIIRDFNNISKENLGSVLAIGNFDGVHLGHHKLIKTAEKIASNENKRASLLFFYPHPSKIIVGKAKPRIITLSSKLDLIKKSGINLVFLQRFNQKFANIKAEDFIKDYLVEYLKISHLVVGYDFAFGHNRIGNFDMLSDYSKKYGYSLTRIGPVVIDENIPNSEIKHTNASFHGFSCSPTIVGSAPLTNQEPFVHSNLRNGIICSSSKLRELITNGDVKTAAKILGYNYFINGYVLKGRGEAQKLGFPTANIKIRKDLVRPKFGVYKVKAQIDNKIYDAIANFGIRPTYNLQEELLEVHIPRFKSDLYGKKIKVVFEDYIRPEVKFSSIEELQTQIKKDLIMAGFNDIR